MKKILILLVILMMVNAYADIEEGKQLHDESCLNCHIFQHDESFYTRDDKKVNNYFKLRSQVSFCVTNLNINWFPDEQMSVVEYLNTTYYHYKLAE